ncbi:hypothetical protein [Streptomyces sp. NPDC051162]|uniref:hypothetical protein n=1 Tax=Streptomyces sp. NPDC051162 TaxID=3154747 RepID=UPI00341614F1
MLSVEETTPDGRRRVLMVRAVPADSAGPVRFAVGRVSARAPRTLVPAAADDLLVIAYAVGVVS